MTQTRPTIGQYFADAFAYSIAYVVIFCLLVYSAGGVGGDAKSGIVLMIMSVAVAVFVAMGYLIATLLLQWAGILKRQWANALLLFVLAEIVVWIIVGDVPAFGLLQKYVYSHHPYSGDLRLDSEIYAFRQQRDLFFSVCGALSSGFFLLPKGIVAYLERE